MKYEKMIQSILEAIGGQENVASVHHCITRLRFKLKDENKADDETVKNIELLVMIQLQLRDLHLHLVRQELCL